ncbi:MAG: protein prkA, partial [Gaiellales bacterium]
QERQFKVSKFGMIDADFSIIAHTNEAEFRRFTGDQKNEALRDRLYPIAVPYTSAVTDEERIYDKLLGEARRRTCFHVAPHTLATASVVAILTRLVPHETLEPLEKLKLYDGQEVGEWRLAQVPELKRAAEHEGMEGLGPRAIINVLAAAATEQARESDPPCLNPIATLMALKDYIERLEMGKEQRERWLGFLADARAELDRVLKDEVRKAFVPAFEEKAQEILNAYLNNVEAYCQNTSLRDPITDEELEPDEKMMRAIEDQVSVSENAKDTFRQGVLMRIGIWLRQSRPLTYHADDQLGRAIEGYLFDQLKDLVTITVSKANPDPEQVKRLNEVMRVMIERRGYCTSCASAVLDYVGATINR